MHFDQQPAVTQPPSSSCTGEPKMSNTTAARESIAELAAGLPPAASHAITEALLGPKVRTLNSGRSACRHASIAPETFCLLAADH